MKKQVNETHLRQIQKNIQKPCMNLYVCLIKENIIFWNLFSKIKLKSLIFSQFDFVLKFDIKVVVSENFAYVISNSEKTITLPKNQKISENS